MSRKPTTNVHTEPVTKITFLSSLNHDFSSTPQRQGKKLTATKVYEIVPSECGDRVHSRIIEARANNAKHHGTSFYHSFSPPCYYVRYSTALMIPQFFRFANTQSEQKQMPILFYLLRLKFSNFRRALIYTHCSESRPD